MNPDSTKRMLNPKDRERAGGLIRVIRWALRSCKYCPVFGISAQPDVPTYTPKTRKQRAYEYNERCKTDADLYLRRLASFRRKNAKYRKVVQRDPLMQMFYRPLGEL